MPRSPVKPKNSVRAFNERAGRRAEAWAALYLRLKGYRILGRRIKTPLGELDLIAQRFDVTAFVEVKTRSFSDQEAGALDAVNAPRLVRAADYWLARHPAHAARNLRFDVIFLAPFTWPRHIVNAFDATGL